MKKSILEIVRRTRGQGTAVKPPVQGYITTYSYGSYQQSVELDNDGDFATESPSELKTITVATVSAITTPVLVSPTDPLILDLTGNGVQTVGLSAGIQFDNNASGVKQGTGWIGAGSGFLVLDRNGNGVIDNGSELFGNNTPLYDAAGNITGYAASGQAALAAQDTNHDGVVNSLDANFAKLKVWQDANQDGVCQPGELQTFAQLGIAGLNVGMAATDQFAASSLLANGNQLTATSTYTLANGTTRATADINLALDPTTTTFTGIIPVTAAAQALPTMLGSGTLRNLNQVASMQTSAGAANDAVFEIRRDG